MTRASIASRAEPISVSPSSSHLVVFCHQENAVDVSSALGRIRALAKSQRRHKRRAQHHDGQERGDTATDTSGYTAPASRQPWASQEPWGGGREGRRGYALGRLAGPRALQGTAPIEPALGGQPAEEVRLSAHMPNADG